MDLNLVDKRHEVIRLQLVWILGVEHLLVRVGHLLLGLRIVLLLLLEGILLVLHLLLLVELVRVLVLGRETEHLGLILVLLRHLHLLRWLLLLKWIIVIWLIWHEILLWLLENIKINCVLILFVYEDGWGELLTPLLDLLLIRVGLRLGHSLKHWSGGGRERLWSLEWAIDIVCGKSLWLDLFTNINLFRKELRTDHSSMLLKGNHFLLLLLGQLRCFSYCVWSDRLSYCLRNGFIDWSSRSVERWADHLRFFLINWSRFFNDWLRDFLCCRWSTINILEHTIIRVKGTLRFHFYFSLWCCCILRLKLCLISSFLGLGLLCLILRLWLLRFLFIHASCSRLWSLLRLLRLGLLFWLLFLLLFLLGFCFCWFVLGKL